MFKLGVLLIVVLVVWLAAFNGDAASTGVRVLGIVAAWMLFTPVRRALWGRPKEPKAP